MNTQEKFSLVQITATAILAVTIALGGWSMKTSVDNSTRITKLESQVNVEQQQKIEELLHNIDNRLTKLEGQVDPTQNQRIADSLHNIDKRLSIIENQLDKK